MPAEDFPPLGELPPARTEWRPITINPRMVDHCNARTNYLMIRHWFNPIECYECRDLLDLIGKVEV